MKKIVLALAILAIVVSPVLADYSVTVAGWTASTNGHHEKVLLDGVEKCSITVGDPTICSFIVPALTNQTIWIQAFDETEENSSQPLVGATGTGLLPPVGPFTVNSTYMP